MKYFDFENEGLDKSLSSCDNIIYRYAGILLMYGECLNETNDPANAVKYVNMVRERAGVALRTDRLTPVMEAHFNHRTPGLAPDAQGSDNGMSVESAESTSGTPARWKWSGKSDPILFPIPYNQIQLMTNWEQNCIYK